MKTIKITECKPKVQDRVFKYVTLDVFDSFISTLKHNMDTSINLDKTLREIVTDTINPLTSMNHTNYEDYFYIIHETCTHVMVNANIDDDDSHVEVDKDSVKEFLRDILPQVRETILKLAYDNIGDIIVARHVYPTLKELPSLKEAK